MFVDVVNEMKKAVEEKDRPKFVEMKAIETSTGNEISIFLNKKSPPDFLAQLDHKGKLFCEVGMRGKTIRIMGKSSEILEKMGWN